MPGLPVALPTTLPADNGGASTPVVPATLSGAPIVTINGVIVTAVGVPPIQDIIGQRGRVTLDIEDTGGAYAIARGQTVVITDSVGTRVYAGFVDSAKLVRLSYSPAVYGWTVACVDNVYRADKRIAAATYSNQTCGFIANDLLTNYLAAEGVTAGTIQAGPTVTSFIINYETVWSAIDRLATLAGFWCNIDLNSKLQFAARSTNTAPWTFDGSQADDVTGNSLLALESTAPLYRNGQYVLGITEVTSAQTETFKGDGTAKAFALRYPVHQVPSALTVNGVTKTLGIKGVDSGKDWYWAKGDNVLAQDSGGTALISTDTLSVTYLGEYPTLVYSEDTAQVTAEATLEGNVTSGKVQEATTDNSLVTTAQGTQLAAALLTKYATSGRVLTFSTLHGGLASAQLLTVNLPAPWNVSNEAFLIESVVLRYDELDWWYDVTAVSGPANDTWVNFFQRIAAQGTVTDTSGAGSSGTVTLLQAVSESWTWGESVTETVQACALFPITFPKTLC